MSYLYGWPFLVIFKANKCSTPYNDDQQREREKEAERIAAVSRVLKSKVLPGVQDIMNEIMEQAELRYREYIVGNYILNSFEFCASKTWLHL